MDDLTTWSDAELLEMIRLARGELEARADAERARDELECRWSADDGPADHIGRGTR